MIAAMTRRARSGLLVAVAALCASLVFSETAFAQRPGGSMRRGPTGKRPGGQLPGKTGGSDDRTWTDTGQDRCRIVKFEPVTDAADEALVGYLSVKPMVKNAKTLKLIVRKTESFKIEIAGQQVDLDALAGLEWKGLICDASWGSASAPPSSDSGDKEIKKKSKSKKQRELRTLTLETLPVEGSIESLEGDSVVVKVRPQNNLEWPDAEAKGNENGGNTGGKKGTNKPVNDPKPTKAPLRKLKLKVMDDFTKFEGREASTLELGDFQAGLEIEAVVVCGTKSGLMVVLKTASLEGKKEEEKPKEGPRPPEGGRGRPGGRRGGGGGGGPGI